MNKVLPDTIRHIIEREIERFSVEEQYLLGVASAIGLRFSIILLGMALGRKLAE